MVSVAGFGIGIDELKYIGLALIIVSTIGNLILFQDTEGAIPVLDRRVIGYPECAINISPLNSNYTVLSFCIAPSADEISSLSKTLSFQQFQITGSNNFDKTVNLINLVFTPLSVIILIIKVFLSVELAIGIVGIVGKLFSLLADFGLL